MLVITAPGQGSQTPGFLAPWLDLQGAPERVRWWSAVTGLDLVRLGTTADADEIRDTAVAQPLLLAGALLSAAELFPHGFDLDDEIGAVAGHSVGELAAAVVAGALSAESALVLVRERGRAMASAAAATPTGMTAVLGGDALDVEATLHGHGLTAANVNGAGQVVAAGTLEQLAALAASPPAGARLRPLAVAGAFHTEHMAPATEHLSRLAAGVTFSEPQTTLLSNLDGEVVASGAELRERLVAQVAAPVRWDSCQRTLAGLGATALIELAPGGTLTGLAKRALPGIDAVALRTPDDLEAARTLLDRYRSTYPTTVVA